MKKTINFIGDYGHIIGGLIIGISLMDALNPTKASTIDQPIAINLLASGILLILLSFFFKFVLCKQL